MIMEIMIMIMEIMILTNDFFLTDEPAQSTITKWLAGGERPPPKAMIPINPFSALCL